MNIRIRVPQDSKLTGVHARRWLAGLTAGFLLSCIAGASLFGHEYSKYQQVVNARMQGPIFANTARIYAAPPMIFAGQHVRPSEVVAMLKRAEYSDARDPVKSTFGSYKLQGNTLEIMPGPESYHSAEPARIIFADGAIASIGSSAAPAAGADNPQSLSSYELEPVMVTALYDQTHRSKRRLVTYDEIPKNLRDAIISIEDRRFFEHNGVNYRRLAKAAFTDVLAGRYSQGASTLTMQFAKGYFLTDEKKLSRKFAQIMIALQLEQRFSKQQIFETYVNWVPMGQRGSFAINGMGEAAQAYFGKDIKNLNLQECALLAAIIQAPSQLTPFRHPEHALERRNLVLESMVGTGAISREEADKAKAMPLKLAPVEIDSSDAPYFVDMVRDSLLSNYSEEELNNNGMRIYTTLDPDLQKAAAEAVEAGGREIDALIAQRRTKKVRTGKGKSAKTETIVANGPRAQIALIALDPHTGKVLALAGGRNYGASQFNHVLASRPTGSIFKPFVYATALNSALGTQGSQPVYTETSMVDDTESVFVYGNRTYTPRNYHNEYHGPVIARFALAHSLNNATVKLAEMVGYEQVAELAKNAGIASVKPTPAMALGSYDATPMEMAGAYTVFANGGTRVSPMLVGSVRDSRGEVLQDFAADKKPVLDPRVAYLATNMMEEVLRDGTAVRVRALGFTAPAAGKTGTSHDGWFAGYNNDLLCIVWVGFDDYSDLELEGAHSAAPVWAMFMKKAVTLPHYNDVKPFAPPSGVVTVRLDKATNLISTPACPDSYEAAYIEGTEPKETCDHSPAPAATPSAARTLAGLGDRNEVQRQ